MLDSRKDLRGSLLRYDGKTGRFLDPHVLEKAVMVMKQPHTAQLSSSSVLILAPKILAEKLL